MRVYLDDIRMEPKGWVRAYTAEEAIDLLKTGKVEALSLDHDLGAAKTGYDVLLWIEEQVYTAGFTSPSLTIHSANPVGVQKMKQAIESIERFTKATPE